MAALFVATASTGMAQKTSNLKGSYGFLVSVAQLDSAGENGGGLVGTMNFDGEGKVSGPVVVKPRTGGLEDPALFRGSFTGTYTVNDDLTGAVSLTFDFGFDAKLAFTITDGGKSIQFVDGPGSTSNQGVIFPTLQGANPQSLTGALPAAFFFSVGDSRGIAVGNIPLTLARISTEGGTVYGLSAPVTANNSITCPDGKADQWTTTVSALTVAVGKPDDRGNFLASILKVACGATVFETYSGFAALGQTATGASILQLRFNGFLLQGSARAIDTGGGAATPNGTFGFQISGAPFPFGNVGVMSFDGSGKVTASFIGVGGTTAQAGTYAADSEGGDGAGTLTLRPTANPSANPAVFAYMTVESGNTLLLLRTSGGGNGGSTVTGTARLQ